MESAMRFLIDKKKEIFWSKWDTLDRKKIIFEASEHLYL
jgi:hypothetical protein